MIEKVPKKRYSTILQLRSYDKSDSLNITLFRGTVFFNIFRNKQVFLKFSLTHAILFLFNEQLHVFSNEISNSSDPLELYVVKTNFIPEKKQSVIQYYLGIGRNHDYNKYYPFYLRIKYPFKNYDQVFQLPFPKNISKDKNKLYPCSGITSFQYFKYIFTTYIPYIISSYIGNRIFQEEKDYEQARNQI
jgi:hypothetical protein